MNRHSSTGQRRPAITEDETDESGASHVAQRDTFLDYVKLVVYLLLLVIPVYAIAHSAINADWIMMLIDALFVPVGFVHGILLLLGVVG